jgi:hypothetical protein
MGRNVNYDYWVESINKMSEDELVSILQNSGGYNPEYIQLLKDRLAKDFHYTQQVLDDALVKAEVNYHNEKVAAETDRLLGLLGKFTVIVSLIFLNGFAIIAIVILRNWKTKNSLGQRRYLYNEVSRKWLQNSVYVFLAIWLVLLVISFIFNRLSE